MDNETKAYMENMKRRREELSKNWRWTGEELQSKAKPGMIVETTDCAYWLILSKSDEGLFLGHKGDNEGTLWPWQKLQGRECLLFTLEELEKRVYKPKN